jgi:hypothetical protein
LLHIVLLSLSRADQATDRDLTSMICRGYATACAARSGTLSAQLAHVFRASERDAAAVARFGSLRARDEQHEV